MMGDLKVCSARHNGVVLCGEDRLYSSSSPPTPLPASNPDPCSIGSESWASAERTAQEIVWRIQPTLATDHKRKEVIKYVQRLIRKRVRCEVFPYGSVPLKTYLPDGDIDLTTLSCPSVEDTWVSDVHAVLREEEHNEAARFEVKDIHCIDAEVKLVKCIVQNIVVDISFNQLGGLCTLCFLEQVDRLVGKDHLFKRSIILIKAWCYYESRILGAHHGLLSTYALETLVLYIFHQFHSSLNAPLAVLYRFLEYFSRFDWESYCISLSGPVCKSSLPDIVAEVQENGGDDLLLSEEFLRNCAEMFSVSPKGSETNSRAFTQKHLNIIDPLKENNNLGRSVNRGNFYRIRSAFRYGARKLGWILMLPGERIANELNKFFSNTLDRHQSNCWTDIGSDFSSLKLHPVLCSEDKVFLKSGFGFHDDKISGIEVTSGIINGPERHLQKVVSSELVPELDHPVERNALCKYRFAGDAKQLASSGTVDIRSTNDSHNCLSPDSTLGSLVLGNIYHASHFNNSQLSRKNEKIENRNPCLNMPQNSDVNDEKIENRNPCQNMPLNSVTNDEMGSALCPEVKEKLGGRNSVCSCINHEGMSSTCSVISSSVANISCCNGERYIVRVSGSSEALKCLLDLSGDYDSHLRNLQYGQLCHGYAVSPLPCPPVSPQLQIMNPRETICDPLQIKKNVHSQMSKNGVALGTRFYDVSHPTSSCAAYGLEEKKNPRGTGTFLPKLNCRSYKVRPVSEKGRNHAVEAHGQLQRHTYNNGLAPAPREVNSSDEGCHELSHDEFPVLVRGKSGSSDSHQPPHLSKWGSFHANGFSHPSEKFESVSLCPQPWGAPLPERSSQPELETSQPLVSASSSVAPVLQSPKPLLGNNEERVEVQFYHLKDEDEFPPLSH
uniref:PAP/OAS1 substrate-binding domain superfamily n=1 Tax=Quercus lobata TaxID=97700 RepID=A0A7N2KNM2_QUELO